MISYQSESGGEGLEITRTGKFRQQILRVNLHLHTSHTKHSVCARFNTCTFTVRIAYNFLQSVNILALKNLTGFIYYMYAEHKTVTV